MAAIGYFRESAEKLIEEKGAVDALAAALAHISGATALEQRSLLSSDVVSRCPMCLLPWQPSYTAPTDSLVSAGFHHSAADVFSGDAQHRIRLENPERAAGGRDRDPRPQDDLP